MEVILQPITNLRPRYWVMGLMMVLVFLVPIIAWWLRVAVCIVLFILAGTYRVSAINGDKFQTRLFVGFMALKPQKCNLPGVVYIETKYNSNGFFGETLPRHFPLVTIFDMMIPLLGGAYEIWLITAKGREIAAWQGLDQNHFEENVALLKSRSGAEIRGRSK